MRSAVAQLLGRRGVLAAAAGFWVASLAVVAAVRASLEVLGLVLVAGLVILGALNSHRQNRFLAAELRRRIDALGRQLDGTSEPTRDRLNHSAGWQENKVESRLATLSTTLDEAVVAIQRGPENTRRLVVRDTAAAYRQLEALLNLYSMMPVRARVPAMRGWVASPDLITVLVETVRAERPRLTVECGSGVSTLWCALALREFGLEGRHVALEHDERFAQQTRTLLEAHGVAGRVEVRLAQLETFRIGQQDWTWYARKAWDDLDDIDLVFVDGPPGTTAKYARYPALPLLADRLGAPVTVVVDDLVRSDEQEVVHRWLAEYPWLTEARLKVEKAASVLRGTPPG